MNRYLKCLYALLIGLLIFTIIRLGIFVIYYDVFKDNSGLSIFLAIIHGIRFDLSIFLTIMSPFIAFLVFPINSHKFHKIIYWAIFVLYMVIIYCLVVDLLYFGHVNRHLASEISMIFNDMGFIISMIKEHILYIIVYIIFIIITGYFWGKFANIKVKEVKYERNSLIKSVVYIILIAGVVFIFIRSSFDMKPISTINAFVSGSNSLGNLTLNGLFTSLRYMTENHNISEDMYTFYDEDEAYNFITSLRNDNCEPALSFNNKPNVIFLLLESWSAYYVDSFSRDNNSKKFQVTPNLDRFAGEGIQFLSHYTPEKRSISAIQSILLGVPPMDGLPRIGFGLEVISGSRHIGSILSKEGYDSVFVKASRRNSHYMDVIAKSLGFKEYYGQEDIKQVIDYPDYSAAKFGWDYEAYIKMAEVLENKKEPFFAFLFTGVTHVPYALPNDINVKFPHNKDNESGFLNTLVYADWSLGEFIKKIEKEEYFRNTIFIFTADHILGRFEDVEYPNDYRVPLVIWSPLIKEHINIDYPTSHIDMLPTILGLLNIDYNRDDYIGENMFCKNDNSYSITHSYGSAGIVKKDKWLKHSFKYMLESSPEDMAMDEKDYLSKILLSYYQEGYKKMIYNK